MNLFGDRLRDLREDRNLKQQDVARELYISNKVLSSYERNVAFPSIELLKRICEFYNVSADYLLQTDLKQEKTNLSTNEPKMTVLTGEQAKIIAYYDRLNEEQKDAVKGLMVLYHTENQHKKPPVG